MMKWLSIILFVPCIAYAHTFTYDQCLDSSEWISVTMEAKKQKIPYDQIDEAARNHMDALSKVKPHKAFILDPQDDEMFFSMLERVYQSNKTPDEEETNYLNDCVKRITPN